MKQLQALLAITIVLWSCDNKQLENRMREFKAEKVFRTATFTVEADIETVFPLFGAFEERKWEREWDPKLIYPAEEIIEVGTTFTTHGLGEESEFLWRVSWYEPERHKIQYLVSTENRYWTILVRCKAQTENQTLAEVTYSFIGLNEKGNELNKLALESMYRHNLQDWQKALNYYLQHGEAI